MNKLSDRITIIVPKYGSETVLKRFVRIFHQDFGLLNNDKIGKSGKPIKSNITDNESAKMKTSHGVIQGYDGVAAVDDKHQVIVHAQAVGEAQEHGLLQPMIDGTRDNLSALSERDDVFKKIKLTADAGFHICGTADSSPWPLKTTFERYSSSNIMNFLL